MNPKSRVERAKRGHTCTRHQADRNNVNIDSEIYLRTHVKGSHKQT